MSGAESRSELEAGPRAKRHHSHLEDVDQVDLRDSRPSEPKDSQQDGDLGSWAVALRMEAPAGGVTAVHFGDGSCEAKSLARHSPFA